MIISYDNKQLAYSINSYNCNLLPTLPFPNLNAPAFQLWGLEEQVRLSPPVLGILGSLWFFLLSNKRREDMKKNSKPEVTFPLAAFLEMAEEFFLITYFSFNQNKYGLKLNTWHVVFQHKWLKLGRAACKIRQGP